MHYLLNEWFADDVELQNYCIYGDSGKTYNSEVHDFLFSFLVTVAVHSYAIKLKQGWL
ncbi:MAG: hypothetical protein AAGC45_09085 [Bacteroidota bacterium]